MSRDIRRSAVVTAIAAVVIASACGRKSEPTPPAELPTLSFTHWTARTEVFAEHPPLVGGETVRFAVHLTTLGDFKALNAGRPRIDFVSSTGQTTTLPGSDPLRPGAFRVEGKLPAAGTYTWMLLVEAPALSDRHNLGHVTVYPNHASALKAAEAASSEKPGIAYLKEMQWTNPFATDVAAVKDLRTAVRAPATITAVSGGEAVISAPAAGRVAPGGLPQPGSTVAAGQVLARFEPRLDAQEDRAALLARVDEAKLALQAADVERDRARRLLAEQAVPGRRVEDAERAVAVAQSQVRAATARLEQREQTLRAGGGAAGGNAYSLRAPIAGRLVSVTATPGASYDEGAVLFRIVRTDRVLVQAAVPASEAARLAIVTAAAIEVPGVADPEPLALVRTTNTGVIDPATRALPVLIEVRNPGGRLLIGQAVTAILYTPERDRAIAIPAAAVLFDAGRPMVFVQVSGETFERRPIEIATRDGPLVGVKSGVRPGERVVVRGAYEVLLASAAKGLPAEGHVH